MLDRSGRPWSVLLQRPAICQIRGACHGAKINLALLTLLPVLRTSSFRVLVPRRRRQCGGRLFAVSLHFENARVGLSSRPLGSRGMGICSSANPRTLMRRKRRRGVADQDRPCRIARVAHGLSNRLKSRAGSQAQGLASRRQAYSSRPETP